MSEAKALVYSCEFHASRGAFNHVRSPILPNMRVRNSLIEISGEKIMTRRNDKKHIHEELYYFILFYYVCLHVIIKYTWTN